MSRISKLFILVLVVLTFPLRHLHGVRAGNPPAEGKESVLKAADISPKIFPERVFFRGQVAPAQLRNTGGVHFADDLYVLAGLVDSSGYSTGIREKRSEEHTSELQSLAYLVCRLLLEKKKKAEPRLHHMQ